MLNPIARLNAIRPTTAPFELAKAARLELTTEAAVVARPRRTEPIGTNGGTQPTRGETLIMAHRGQPGKYPENTLESFEAALKAGADGIELDLCVTKDGHIVLWHDNSPMLTRDGSVVELTREEGLEPAQGFKPSYRRLDRKRISEMTLAEVQKECYYTNIATGEKVVGKIPTLEQFFAWAQKHPEMKKFMLDLKLPKDDPAAYQAMAKALKQQLDASGLKDKATILLDNENPKAADAMELLLAGKGYAISRDLTYPSLKFGAYDTDASDEVKRAIEKGQAAVSVGRPKLGHALGFAEDLLNIGRGLLGMDAKNDLSAFDNYLAYMKSARAEIDKSGKPIKLVAWTINDPDEMADLLKIPVDEILTDKPELLAKVRAEVKAGTYRYERPKSALVKGLVNLADIGFWVAGAAFTGFRWLMGKIGLHRLGAWVEGAGFWLIGHARKLVRTVAEGVDKVVGWVRSGVNAVVDGAKKVWNGVKKFFSSL